MRRRRSSERSGPPLTGRDHRVVEYKIDLHGMTVAQAQAAVDRHIQRNRSARSPWVLIVHGRGTGALRDAIRDELARDNRIKRFDFAPPNMGGDGATLAELRL